MSLSLTFDVRDTASPRLQTFISGMGDRAPLHDAIGEDVRNLARSRGAHGAEGSSLNI